MEIHFYPNMAMGPKGDMLCDWASTVWAISEKRKTIHTTQMGLLSTTLFEQGYRIFYHPLFEEAIEIKLGANVTTDRMITMGNNLFKLWLAGEFF